MAKQGKESAEEYADRFLSEGSFPLFKGVGAYWELFRAGRIVPYLNYIRVTLGGIVHTFYYADEDGNLVRHDDPNSPTYDPKDIISGQWTLESIVPKNLAGKWDFNLGGER
jgi:hypothetical protein